MAFNDRGHTPVWGALEQFLAQYYIQYICKVYARIGSRGGIEE